MKTLLMKICFLILIIGSATVHAAGVDARVTQELATTGQAKTIIALNVPDAASSRLRASRAAVSRDPIGETQEIVLNDLPAGSYELTYQYSHVPGLAMTLTPASFEILKDHPQVKYIQFDELEHLAVTEAISTVMADHVHLSAYTGTGVTVAVLDSGINALHDYFASKIQVQHCALSSGCPATPDVAEDGNGHGSHVSGIVTKVAPGAKIAAVKVCNDLGGCQLSDTIAGLNWVAANHSANAIKIVNMSLASDTLYSDSCDVEDATRKAAVDALINAGITVFAAAGNDGGTPNGKSTLAAPACLSNTIAVGATYDRTYPSPGTSLVCSKIVTDANTVTCFSNSSLWLDILAPGSEITSSWKDSSSATKTEAGTSMATPIASGVAALMLQKNTTLTPAQIKAKLKKNGINVTDTNGITRPRIHALNTVSDVNAAQPIFEIVSNGSYLRDQTKLDFSWTTTNEPVTKTLTLKNSGTTTLNITAANIPSGFSFVPAPPSTLTAGEQTTLQIKLDATTVGNYTGNLQFTTDDPVANTVQINLSGKVCDMQSIPFSENFEGGTIPDCWRVISHDNSIRDWDIFGATDISVIGGTKSAATMSATAPTTADDDWLILPRMTLGMNDQFAFKALRYGTGTETFHVKLSTTGNNTADFTTTLAANISATTTATTYSYSLSDYAGQKVYLAIESISAALNNSSLVIDDVQVTNDSTPPVYQSTAPTTSNPTTIGFDLTTRLNEIGKTYYVVLLASNSNVPSAAQVKAGQDGSGTTTNVKASGFINVTTAGSDFNQTINSLTHNTAYKVYVISEDTSANLQTTVTPLNVTTTTPADTTAPSFNSTPAISAITASNFALTVNSNETGKAYYVVLPDASPAPNANDIKTDTISGVVTKGILNLTANTPLSQTIGSLTANTAYKIYVVLEDAVPNLQATATAVTVTTTATPDTTAPSFNSTTAINTTTSSFTITVNSNETGKVYYVVLPASESAPSTTQVKNGEDSTGTITNVKASGFINVTTAGSDFNQTINSLTHSTAYKVYLVAEDNSLNLQSLVTILSVSTTAPDTTAPSFNSTPTISAITASNFALTINSNETGKAYYVVLPNASAAPNANDIKAEQTTSTISGVVTKGILNLTANTPLSQTVGGLTANTAYKIYVVLEDVALNLSNITMLSATTTTAVTTPSRNPGYAIIERKDGTGTGRITSYSTGQPVWAPTIVMTATPDPGSVFVKWTGNIHSQDCYSDQPTIYVRLNAIKTCTATFDQITADNQSLVPVKLAAYYLPGRENSGKALIRITNTNLTPVEVKGTLYHASGQMLGIANSVLIPTLAPQATVELSTIDLAKLCSAPAWTGLAWLHLTTPTGLKLLNLLENDNTLISNFTSPTNDNTLYNLPASTSAEQANIVLINTSDKIQPVTATLYADSGQILGKANTMLANVAARGIFTLSIKQLELLVNTVPWTNHVAKLQITSPSTGIKAMATLLSSDATVMNLTPTHDNAAFNVPGATNLDQAFVYVSNTTNSPVQVQATLYHQEGYLLGSPNTILVNSLAPQATQLFSVNELEKIFNVPTWQKRARLMITSPTTGIKVMTLIRNSSGVSNISAVTTRQAFYLPNATDADKAYVRMTNLSNMPVTVTGVAYAENGQMLGSGILTQLAAQTTTALSMPLLESYLKIMSWNGKMRLVISPAELQIMGTIRSNTGQLVDMSDVIGD